MGIWNRLFNANARDPSYDKETDVIFENFFDDVKGTLNDYGRTIAANFIARTFMEVKVMSGNDLIDKRLNLKPNKNQNSAEFWRDIVYKLITDNEVLVILNDSKDLLVADSFDTEEWTNFGDKYKHVRVNEFTFQRVFQAEDVWHITLSSENWQSVFSGMNRELDTLYSYVLGNAKLKNQLRAVLSVDANGNLAKDGQSENINNVIEKIRRSISNNQVAVFPELKGLTYEEKSSQGNVNATSGTDEITKLKQMVVSDIASALGVPAALLFGTQADNTGALSLYRQNVVRPIKHLLESEVSKKLAVDVSMSFKKDHSILDEAEQVEKLISSGVLTRNMVADFYDLPPIEGGDQLFVTKNYAMKGGDEDSGD
ncbi:phage portal protein [Weissella viridescens]